mmetsp:Transcript_24849/g.81888  ORF Transcript_24849/g.81888 Transcript_24849/m.81888 type:complete len:449 (+) Transcript_24849:783-2129(+)
MFCTRQLPAAGLWRDPRARRWAGQITNGMNPLKHNPFRPRDPTPLWLPPAETVLSPANASLPLASFAGLGRRLALDLCGGLALADASPSGRRFRLFGELRAAAARHLRLAVVPLRLEPRDLDRLARVDRLGAHRRPRRVLGEELARHRGRPRRVCCRVGARRGRGILLPLAPLLGRLVLQLPVESPRRRGRDLGRPDRARQVLFLLRRRAEVASDHRRAERASGARRGALPAREAGGVGRLETVALLLPLLLRARLAPLPGRGLERVGRAVLARLRRDEPRLERVVLLVGAAKAVPRGPLAGGLVPHHLGPLLLDDALLRRELLPARLRPRLWQRLLARQLRRGRGKADDRLALLRREDRVQPVRHQLRVVARRFEQVRLGVRRERLSRERRRVEGGKVRQVVLEVVLLFHLDGRPPAARRTLRQELRHVEPAVTRGAGGRHGAACPE